MLAVLGFVVFAGAPPGQESSYWGFWDLCCLLGVPCCGVLALIGLVALSFLQGWRSHTRDGRRGDPTGTGPGPGRA